MTPDLAAFPASALALAPVTAPARAPVALPGAREESLRQILCTAADGGVRSVVVRPEGDEERLLAQAWPFPSPFEVTVRTVSAAEGLDRLEARARRSLERMGLPRAETLVVAQPGDLAGSDGRALWDRMKSLKDRGLYRRIGFCAAVTDGPALLARRFQPDVVRLSCNLLDQAAHRGGELDDLAAQGVQVQLGSVFAKGALFSASTIPPAYHGHELALSRVRRRLAEARVDPMQAALAYGLSLPGRPRLIVSVASAAETRAVLAAVHAPAPSLDWAEFDLGGAPAAAARAVSSAA